MEKTKQEDYLRTGILFILNNTLTSLGDCDDRILRQSIIKFINGASPKDAISDALKDYIDDKKQ